MIRTYCNLYDRTMLFVDHIDEKQQLECAFWVYNARELFSVLGWAR